MFLAAGQRAKADAARQELDDYARRVGDPFVQTYQMIAEAWRLALEGEFEAGVDVVQRFAGTAAGAEPFGQARRGRDGVTAARQARPLRGGACVP